MTSQAAPKLLHAITGAAVAARDYTAYVTPEIIGAIRWHTTGRRGMTLFETLVYLADYIEDTRTFDECVALREYFHGASPETMSEKDARVHLYKTVIKSVEATVEGLTREGLPVDTNTTEYGEYTKALLTSGQET